MATSTTLTSVFPMDSSDTPTINSDGLPEYDRAYNASDLRRVMRTLYSDGVFTDYLDEFNVALNGTTWQVGSGAAIAHGLLIDNAETVDVIEQSELTTSHYAFIIVAGCFDKNKRDAEIYAVVQTGSSYEPVRTDSVWELVLARIDWGGTISDLRLDDEYCGAVSPFVPVDTDSFMSSLKAAVSQFDLNIGDVVSLEPGMSPYVTVRHPDLAGDTTYIDFGIPKGATGDKGKDGDEVPTTWIRPEDDPPQAQYDAVWLVDDKDTHTIVDIRAYETDKVYPSEDLYPSEGLYPGGIGQWVSHTLSPSLVGEAS